MMIHEADERDSVCSWTPKYPHPYMRFSAAERRAIRRMFDNGYSVRDIAAVMGRAPSSIDSAITRNRKEHDER